MFHKSAFKVLINLILLLVLCTSQVAAAPNNESRGSSTNTSLNSSPVMFIENVSQFGSPANLPMPAALTQASQVSAGNNVWTSNGPYGGHVLTLAIDPVTPTTIYAKTDEFGGLFKSTDEGGTWTAVNTGLTDYHFAALVIDSLSPSTLYVGTNYGGVFKSTNGGGNWNAANTGLTNLNVCALAIDPMTPSTLYAGICGGGVFKSIDGGYTWTVINSGLTNMDIRALAIDPVTPTTLYAGGYYGGGVFKSTDGGSNWTKINTSTNWVYGIVIDPVTPTTLYLLKGDILKSIDGGSHWSTVNTGLPAFIPKALAIDPITPTTLYIGGDYVGGDYGGGVFKSTDGGGVWSAVNTGLTNAGLTNTNIFTLAINPATPSTLYAGTRGGGVFKSTDEGGHWNAVNNGVTAIHVKVLAVDPLTPTTLYAGTYYHGGVFKSTNGGSDWTAINNGLTYNAANGIYALAIDPVTPTTIYAGSSNGLFKSSNGGGNWIAVTTGLTDTNIRDLVIDPVTPTTLYAGINGGVFKSINEGINWTAVNSGLTNTDIRALAIDPVTPTTLYAGAWSGVFKSTDGGSNWTYIGLAAPIFTLAIDPVTPTTIYAGGWSRSVFKSTDGGGTWTTANTGITDPGPVTRDVVALSIDPSTPTTLYAGSWGGGVFKSVNGGGNWAAINTGLANTEVQALAIDPITPTIIYAGTYGGVFGVHLLTYSISGTVRDSSNNPISGVTVSSGANYPSTTTDAVGNYTLSGFAPGVYAITPSKTGYTFDPISRAIEIVSGNMTGVDFTGTALIYSISGRVVDGSSNGIAGASVSDGAGHTASTDSSGNYTITVPYNWSGTVTPSKLGYTFSPSNRVYANVQADQTVQNYTAIKSKPPVIVVHGFQGLAFEGITPKGYHCDGIQLYNGGNSTLTPDSSLTNYTHLAQWLEEDGYQVWIAHLESTPIYTAGLEENAKCLQKQIETVWGTNPQPLTIIGHSMGGVVSRAALKYLPAKIKVKSLYTLGSPHAGLPTDIFKFVNANCILQRGMCEMSLGSMNYYSGNLFDPKPFNQKHINLENVEYNFFGGNGGSGILWGLLYATFQGANDGLVGQHSAVGWLNPSTSFGLNNWTSKSTPGQYFTNETHPALSVESLAYYVAPKNQYSQSYMCIRDLMINLPDTQNCQSIKAQSLQANSAEMLALAADSYSFTETKTGHLNAGQSTSLPLTIDGTGATMFYLNWNNGTAPSFTLTRPDSVTITPQYALDNPTLVTYETASGSPEAAPYQAYSFVAGQVGVWQLNITASTDPIDFQSFGMIDNSSRTLAAQTDKNSYAIGDTAMITATLSSAGVALAGATVNAKLTSPDAVETLLPLTDNLDGTYTGSYPIPDAPGYLTLDVTASGTDEGVLYTRNTNLITTIAPNDLQLTGTYNDLPRDNNADAFYDFLDFTAEVNLTAPGEYAVSAELYAGDQLITQAGDFFPLIAGTQTITLPFDGGAIYRSGLNGPYTVKNLYLTPIDVGITAQSVATAWTTGAYSYTQFVDVVSPLVSSVNRVSAPPASAASVNFTVTFSEPVTEVDTVSPFTDFSLTATGVIGASIIGVTPVSGTTYTVSVNTGRGAGTIRLDVMDDNSIVDAASNPLGGAAIGDGNFTSGEVYTIKTAVETYIGGVLRGGYLLGAGESTRQNYVGVDSGPVKVVSTDGTQIVSAIREAWAVNGVTTSFFQMMGLPQEQLSDTYVFPGYNNVTLNEQLRISNVDTVPSTVTVTIGGVLRGTYPLAAGEAVRINYAGLDSGPVIVQGTTGVKIISAIREAWAVNGVTKSFVQLMGLPKQQLSDKYVFPGYNNVTLNEQLRIGNVDSVASTVTVTIGGVLRGTYILQPNEAVRVNYAGVDSGPVIVQGTAGVKIISAIREAWAVNGVTTSFAQLMGLPSGQLSNKYVFPGYNNVTLNDQLRIGNVDSVQTTVTVTIGGVLRGSYTLQPNEAVRVNYAGLDSGPVVVEGSAGVKIISAIREAWAVNGVTTSFTQLMGLPFEQLSSTFWFPAYNNVTLNEQLRIAVP